MPPPRLARLATRRRRRCRHSLGRRLRSVLLVCAGLAGLAIGSSKTVCRKVDVDARRPSDQGFGLEVDARKLVQCDELDLSILHAQDAGEKLLVSGARELARYLGANRRLTRLKLTGNFVGDEGVALLAAALSNTALESLWLGRNNLTDAGLEALAAALKPEHLGSGTLRLRELRLEFNSITSAAALRDVLDPSVCVPMLRRVDLSGNRLDDSAAGVLADALTIPYQQLQELVLSFNRVTDAGAAAVASVLAKDPASLTGVWLDGNNVSDAGAQLLAQALQNNTHLQNLSIRRTEGDGGHWGDAIRVLLSLPGTAARVDGKGIFDCRIHVAQAFTEYPQMMPTSQPNLAACQQTCLQVGRPGCAGVEWSSETQECWITPFATSTAQAAAQLVHMPMHYLCDNTRTDYAVLTLSEL